MRKETGKETKTAKYQDFINFQPVVIKYLSEYQINLIMEHSIILNALKKKPLTVKEIHDLFYNNDEQKHSYSIKTIYRHLKKLEREELVMISGHRVTEGSRIPEKIFSRTARIFCPRMTEEELNIWLEVAAKEFGQNLSFLISEIFQLIDPEIDRLNKSLQELSDMHYRTIKEFYEETKQNERLADFYAKINHKDIQNLTNDAALLTTLLRHPEIFDLLKELTKSAS
ncbi:MAG: hypothetical protein ACFFCQ_17630 [Promethearchaeota archaeon]